MTEHFGQTAAHFQAIGKQYRELYEHMATGAQSLCESDDAGKTLLLAPREVAPSTNLEDASAEAAVEAETAEKAEEPQPESKVDAGERTIHQPSAIDCSGLMFAGRAWPETDARVF